LLCNVGSVNPGGLGRQVAGVLLADAPRPVTTEQPDAVQVPAADLAERAGLYRNIETGEPLRITFADGALRAQPGGALVAVAPTVFLAGGGARRFTFELGNGHDARVRETNGDAPAVLYERVPESALTADLVQYAGKYFSPDAEAVLTLAVEGGRLVALRRPNARLPFTLVYADAFTSPLGFVRFHRNGNGEITQLSVRQARVYDLRFDRMER